jgi:hypothetical protein
MSVCFVTLAAVFVDIVFFHSETVSAQSTEVRVLEVVGPAGLSSAVVNVTGAVGFSCVYAPEGSCAI